jgi:hypothetical protein
MVATQRRQSGVVMAKWAMTTALRQLAANTFLSMEHAEMVVVVSSFASVCADAGILSRGLIAFPVKKSDSRDRNSMSNENLYHVRNKSRFLRTTDMNSHSFARVPLVV